MNLEYIEGTLKIANLVFSLFAGMIALSLFRLSKRVSKKKDFRPWRYLIFALILFAVQEILGALRAFRIFSSPYLTHIVPTVILVLVLFALIHQIEANKGEEECL
jgi:uncharacterized membrane protein